MTDTELTCWCAKALEFNERVESYHGRDFDPLHSAEQNEQLVSWLLREGYAMWLASTRSTIDRYDYNLHLPEPMMWSLDMTIPENRRRAICEAVAKVQKEREKHGS
jgi:hypothetical protein